MRIKYALFVVIALIAMSCNNSEKSGEEKEGFEEKFTKTERLEIIDELEAKAFKSDTVAPKRALANDLMRHYFEYKNLYPKDSVAPEFLFKGAQLAMSIDKDRKAIEVLDKLYDGYPEYEKRVEVLNLIAFIYDYELNDREMARKNYQFLIQNFPDHPYAEDAAARLTTINMSDEELIEHFNKKNQQRENP